MPETYFGTPESRERDARFVGHEWKGDKMTDRVDRETVEQLTEALEDYSVVSNITGGYPPDNPNMTGKAAKTIRALLAEREELLASQGYTYIGKDGKPILVRDLEDQRDALIENAMRHYEKPNPDLNPFDMAMHAISEGRNGRKCVDAIRALSPTPADPLAEAARVSRVFVRKDTDKDDIFVFTTIGANGENLVSAISGVEGWTVFDHHEYQVITVGAALRALAQKEGE